MSACDLLVTKAGGLTTFEAVARRLPMAIDMLTTPMPQESGTAELLIDAGLAKPINHPSDIVAIVEALEHIDNRDKLPLPSKYNLDRTDAVYEIAKIILSNCMNPTQL
jgi:UDP-N-acetylglucosamine:LPS N-acetylglucosamine transferase